MKVVQLQSLAEELDALNLPPRWVEEPPRNSMAEPKPDDFAGVKRPRRNPVNEPRFRRPQWRDDRRGYMREYMRRQRAARRRAIA